MKTAFLVLLGFASVAYADFCGVRRIVYHAPVVVHKPVYHDYHYKETVILVPKAIQVEVTRDHYYSIDSSYQQSLLADAIVGRLLRMQATGQAPRTTSPTGVEKSQPDTQESKAGSYQNEALLKVVNDSCVKCHGASSRNTKLVTADGKLADLPSGKIWECFGLVNSGEMPKASKSLPDEQVKLFYDWAKNARK